MAVKESNGTSSPQVSDADSIQNSLFGEDVVSLSAETAGLFSINNSNNYRYLPQLITVGWQLDEIGNEGWNRGNTEFLFSGMYAPVIHGPNPWFTGGLFGPRYNFIQEGWPVVPYLESRVGFMFTNATGAPNSQAAFGQPRCPVPTHLERRPFRAGTSKRRSRLHRPHPFGDLGVLNPAHPQNLNRSPPTQRFTPASPP
ncbi:MAG: hypothetical protein EBS69_06935 [Verrucomicrobia bacterium]|nr:hypothetical protein [Verrucomicrobiota bacterium]